MTTLYVSDLDGTLLRPDGTLGPRTVEVVNALITSGGLVSIATARSFHSTRRVVAELELRLPLIAYGGATVVDPITGTRLSMAAMPAGSIRTLLGTFAEKALQPVLFVVHEETDRFCWLDGDLSAGVTEFVAQRAGDPRAMPRQAWDEIDLGAVFYISLLGTESELAGFEDTPGCSVLLGRDVYFPDHFWLEFTASEASKGRGVVALKAELGADRVVVFGDNLNDLSMFAVADESYATANAFDDVKARATGVIGSNADEGVAAWLAANAL